MDMEEKILRYINDEMSLEEKKDFKEALQNDSSLREQVENARLLQSAFVTDLIKDISLDEMALDYINDEMSLEEKKDFKEALQNDSSLREQVENARLLQSAFVTDLIKDISLDEMALDYINNEMSLEEKKDFEEALQNDSSLREQVENARLLQSAFVTDLIKDISWEEMIDDYLSDTMDDQEKEWFEERLGKDESLRNKLEMQKAGLASTVAAKIVSNKDAKGTSAWARILKPVSSVAAVIVLALPIYASIHDNGLDDKYLNDYNVENLNSRGDSRGISDLKNALEKYKNGNAEDALQILSDIKEDDPLYSEAMYIKGLILYNKNWLFKKDAVECLRASHNKEAQNLLKDMWLSFLY